MLRFRLGCERGGCEADKRYKTISDETQTHPSQSGARKLQQPFSTAQRLMSWIQFSDGYTI